MSPPLTLGELAFNSIKLLLEELSDRGASFNLSVYGNLYLVSKVNNISLTQKSK